jgi:uncharacterized protein YlaI
MGSSRLEVRCSLCGRKEVIKKTHKEYQRLAKNPDAVYFCQICQMKLQYDASEYNKPKKPIG